MLPAPNLDDRTFQSLVDDARRLVHRRCPEWSEHNISDPGITLIETFAMMVDQLIYRLNRVPDRNYIKFLELLGLELRPPGAARTVKSKSDRFHLRNPPSRILHRAIVDMATADAKWPQRRSVRRRDFPGGANGCLHQGPIRLRHHDASTG